MFYMWSREVPVSERRPKSVISNFDLSSRTNLTFSRFYFSFRLNATKTIQIWLLLLVVEAWYGMVVLLDCDDVGLSVRAVARCIPCGERSENALSHFN